MKTTVEYAVITRHDGSTARVKIATRSDHNPNSLILMKSKLISLVHNNSQVRVDPTLGLELLVQTLDCQKRLLSAPNAEKPKIIRKIRQNLFLCIELS